MSPINKNQTHLQPPLQYSKAVYPYTEKGGAYDAQTPAGYPTLTKDALHQSHKVVPLETKSKGGGFWTGCCAALCCCCGLEACF